MLSVESLCVSVGSKTLLDGVDLALQAGEVLAVVGPNGAGKTTLLKSLTGEVQPQVGQVLFQGRPMAAWSPEERARLLAVLPQSSSLNFPFQVDEVVQLGRLPHDTGIVRDSEIVSLALAEVDIAHLADRVYTTLSGGEKQRVHLARVLAQVWEEQVDYPRCLLLDEPTSALDLAHQNSVLAAARAMAEQGVGVLVILHDLNLASQFADRVLMLNQGRVHAAGKAASVLTAENIEQVFAVSVDIIEHPRNGKPLIVQGEISQ
ncbi:MAG: heme ABC transporter ATP-binding protein [Candidatus Pelagadaptatus aseana]|uniref:heme ABC transporter ATP-binding protein n=1 Tax=Candidatus Pelagadaptatus aseana TaxID=3120508 RepID=UPI0039B30726